MGNRKVFPAGWKIKDWADAFPDQPKRSKSISRIPAIYIFFIMSWKAYLLFIFCTLWIVTNPFRVSVNYFKNQFCHGQLSSRLYGKKRDTMIERERLAETRDFLRHSLLTVDDEKHLAQQYQLGLQLKTQFDVLEKAHNFSYAINEIMSKLEISQPQLLLLIRQSEVAKRVLARANSRLVYHIAEVFRRRGTSMDDLIRYGSEGLFKAIDRFDPDRGFRFSTYASWWIKQAVARNLYDKQSALLDLQRRIARFELSFKSDHKRTPTIDELAEGVGASMKKVREALKAVRVHKISLDAPAYSANSKSSNKKIRMQDIIPSNLPSTTASYEKSVVNNRLQEFLKTIPEEDGELLIMRYGLDGLPPRSINDLSRQYNVTRAKILQLEKTAALNLQLASNR